MSEVVRPCGCKQGEDDRMYYVDASKCRYAELEKRAAALVGYVLEGHDHHCSTCIASAKALRELLKEECEP